MGCIVPRYTVNSTSADPIGVIMLPLSTHCPSTAAAAAAAAAAVTKEMLFGMLSLVTPCSEKYSGARLSIPNATTNPNTGSKHPTNGKTVVNDYTLRNENAAYSSLAHRTTARKLCLLSGVLIQLLIIQTSPSRPPLHPAASHDGLVSPSAPVAETSKAPKAAAVRGLRTKRRNDAPMSSATV